MLQVAGLRKAAHYMVKPLNIVDLLAILPFYIQHVQNWRLAVVHEGEYEALQNLTSTARATWRPLSRPSPPPPLFVEVVPAVA